jgi:hypothetical protein
MSNINDIINLAKADGGKFFVIDEQGDPKLVIMSVEDYERILLGKVAQQVEDIEQINREILRAQLAEEAPKPVAKSPTVSTQYEISKNDLRAEVIDPSFDFEAPRVEIDDL